MANNSRYSFILVASEFLSFRLYQIAQKKKKTFLKLTQMIC